jgi:hypothetical protein
VRRRYEGCRDIRGQEAGIDERLRLELDKLALYPERIIA